MKHLTTKKVMLSSRRDEKNAKKYKQSFVNYLEKHWKTKKFYINLSTMRKFSVKKCIERSHRRE